MFKISSRKNDLQWWSVKVDLTSVCERLQWPDGISERRRNTFVKPVVWDVFRWHRLTINVHGSTGEDSVWSLENFVFCGGVEEIQGPGVTVGNILVWNLVRRVDLWYLFGVDLEDIANVEAVVVVHRNNRSLCGVNDKVKFRLYFILKVEPTHEDLVMSSIPEMNTKSETKEEWRGKKEGETLKSKRKSEKMCSMMWKWEW